jgi:protein-S-isoprenylcysteine O-methyltransferase Ste14
VFAWLGGLTFVSSLSFFAVFYLVSLRRAGPPGGDPVTSTLFNVALFGLFALHHSVMARDRVKRALESIVPAWLERSLYVWVSSVLFAAVCFWWQRIPGVIYGLEPPVSWIGYAVQILGLILILRSSAALSFLELAGIQQVTDATGHRVPATVRKNELVTTGPYRIVRHPLYLGWVLLVFGSPVMTADRLSFASISTIYLAIAVPWEERTLRRIFGADYAAYAERVRWRMVPGLY